MSHEKQDEKAEIDFPMWVCSYCSHKNSASDIKCNLCDYYSDEFIKNKINYARNMMVKYFESEKTGRDAITTSYYAQEYNEESIKENIRDTLKKINMSNLKIGRESNVGRVLHLKWLVQELAAMYGIDDSWTFEDACKIDKISYLKNNHDS